MFARKLGFCASVLLILCTTACTSGSLEPPTPTPDPCGPGQISRYVDAIQRVEFRFNDVVAIASVTSRENLAAVIEDLEEIREEAEELQVPSCAVNARSALVIYIDATIEAYEAILADQPAADVNSALQRAAELRDAYFDAMAEVGGEQ